MRSRSSLLAASIGILLFAAACSDDDPTEVAIIARAQAALLPVIAVDASGLADYEDRSGFGADRLDVEIEIDADDFAAVGIDAGNGFADEIVLFEVTRVGTTLLPPVAMQFGEDRRATQGDITFELTLVGETVPQFLSGDLASVEINGVEVLEGVFVPK